MEDLLSFELTIVELLLLVSVVAVLARRIRVPYTVVLVLVGMLRFLIKWLCVVEPMYLEMLFFKAGFASREILRSPRSLLNVTTLLL